MPTLLRMMTHKTVMPFLSVIIYNN